MATFTRNSTAYKQDGSQVAANAPRFEANGLMVEEGTTNLAVNPGIDNSIGWTIDNKGATVNLGATDGIRKVGKIIQAGSELGDPMIFQDVMASPGDSIAISADVKATKNTYFMVVFFSSTNTSLAVYSNITTPFAASADYVRRSWSPGIVAPANTAYIRCELRALSGTVAGTVYFDNAQFEKKPYATTFHDGTRAGELLSIPVNCLNTIAGTVEFTIDATAALLARTDYPFILRIRSSSVASQYMLVSVGTTGKIYAETKGPPGVMRTAIPTVATMTGKRKGALKWSASEFSLILDGVKYTASGYSTADILPDIQSIAIGSHPSGGNWINTTASNVRFSNIARPDTEIIANQQSGLPLTADQYTTCLLPLQNNIADPVLLSMNAYASIIERKTVVSILTRETKLSIKERPAVVSLSSRNCKLSILERQTKLEVID